MLYYAIEYRYTAIRIDVHHKKAGEFTLDQQKKKPFRPIPGLTREAEEQQLCEITRIAQDNLEKTEKYSGQLSDELHELMETYGTKDKEALALFHNTQAQLQETRRDLLRCRKARHKPYFGRIDFRDQKIPYAESYYVGRVGISRNGSEPVVIDWRAPIASVYYENTIGKCRYTVKNEGSCEIDLKRKRTYEIADDRLIDFFDSDVVANDELLTKYLAKNKSAVLGEIISTIQKEQNTVIRRSPKMNLIVQGVAGSGKTTVAMHRISYILYNYEDDFRPEDFYIIGSNRILLNYITSVLPDLDVYGVSQMTMEQLFVRLLYEDWNPEIHHIRHIGKNEEAVRIKGSYKWFHDLEDFCRDLERRSIPEQEVTLDNGVRIMRQSTVQSCLNDNPLVSMQGKINMLNAILLSRLENEITGKDIAYPPALQKELYKKYRRYFGGDVWKGSIYQVYSDFLKSQESKGMAVPLPDRDFDLYDLAALAYIYKRIKETDGIREASHVIIDEAQDFGMTAYGALYYCLRGCTYTIMGDVSQNIHYGYGLNDWEDLKSLILKGVPGGFGVMKKSYRNTVEISEFATGILRHGSFPVYPVDPIRRHGSPVRITQCRDEEDMIRESINTIRRWQTEGMETIAVICRDEEEASAVSALLSKELDLADTDPETAEFTEGIMVLPVEYTKGLEFDAVLIYHPSAESYPDNDAYVKLLYVAATRALHELAAVHTGDLTDLIACPAPDRKQKSLPEEEKNPKGILPEDSKKGQTSSSVHKSDRHNTQDSPTSGKEQPASKRAAHPYNSVPVNPSSYRFGSVPDTKLLNLGKEVAVHTADLSIRDIKRTRHSLELSSNEGILRLTPVHASVIRVQFMGRDVPEPPHSFWHFPPEQAPAWSARAGKSLAELASGQIKIQIDKRSGAIRFLDHEGRKLLTESRVLPRKVKSGQKICTWNYFDWAREEKLMVKGILNEDLERLNNKARYISFGGKIMRMPLIVSEYGYGLGIASEETVMCCDIPLYGTYLYTEGTGQIDYYFIYGRDYEEILGLYKVLK